MPELPEVENVRKYLSHSIVGKKIETIDNFSNEKIISSSVISQIQNTKIKSVRRHAKYLFLDLDNSLTLISHLRMEGRYYLNSQINPHTRVRFYFEGKETLDFVDRRKFGNFVLVKTDSIGKYLSDKVGKEPFDLTADELALKAKRKSSLVKAFLLDQHNIAGLGNIYVDEVLFASKILPTRTVDTLTKADFEKILENSKIILKKAVELGGSTISSFEIAEGLNGSFQNYLKVHTRVGKPCSVCGTEIKKIKVAGRGSYVCEVCQK